MTNRRIHVEEQKEVVYLIICNIGIGSILKVRGQGIVTHTHKILSHAH